MAYITCPIKMINTKSIGATSAVRANNVNPDIMKTNIIKSKLKMYTGQVR
jgi:hypothetical protein